LRSHDFQILGIDPAKPREQVKASLGADLIVGVHGGALTNMIFMRPGGRLLEFRHGRDDLFFDVFEAMAKAMGFGYDAQVCDLAQHASGYDINNADLIVDLDVLRENLN
jgi:capsular polysaccharide biosynthesis protein